MHLVHHVNAMRAGMENTANTTTRNVTLVVTDVLDPTMVTVSSALRMPSVTVTDIVSVSHTSGINSTAMINATNMSTVIQSVSKLTRRILTTAHVLAQEKDTVRHVSPTLTATGRVNVNVTTAGPDQPAKPGKANATQGVTTPATDLLHTTAMHVPLTPFVTTMQATNMSRNAYVANGGLVKTAASIVDHVHQLAMDAQDLMPTSVRTVYPTLTTRLTELVSVVTNGWAPTAHRSVLTAMRHVKSVSHQISTSVSSARTDSPLLTDTVSHAPNAARPARQQTEPLTTNAQAATQASDKMAMECAKHAIHHVRHAM